MRFLIIILLLVNSVCFSQAKDTAHVKIDTAAIKQQQLQAQIQAINYVLSDMKSTLYGKLNAQEFEIFLKIQDAYIKEKTEQFNPPKPKK